MATNLVDYDEKILTKKIADSKGIIREALQRYSLNRLAVAWTGGKDSTLMLWLIRQVCAEDGIDVPRCFCVDEGDMFPEVQAFLKRYSAEWDLELKFIHNKDVSEAAGGELGAMVKLSDLNERNQREVERLGYEEDDFPYEPESYVGSHLMKTVALNVYLEENAIQAFCEGIRWDEQAVRLEETYFRSRLATAYSPEHDRISPILHFTERDVWNSIHKHGVPFCDLYAEGYRSLRARVITTAPDEAPAWEQDLETTSERGGRRQNKEALMKKLRELGYI